MMRSSLLAICLVLLHYGIEVNGDLDHDPSDHTPSEIQSYMSSLLGRYYDQYDGLSFEDRKKAFAMFIPHMDKDGDHRITIDELNDWVNSKIKEETMKYQSDALDLTSIDENKDGKLSLKEVMDNYEKHQPTADGNEEPNIIEREQKKIEIKFKLADKDQDGFISHNEFQRLTMPEHFSDMQDMFERHFVLDYDSNGDGIILKREFVLNSKNDPNFDAEEDIEQQFEQYDQNQDGSLSIQEIQMAAKDMQPLFEVKLEIEGLFTTLDKLNNGYLTYDELADNHEYFTNRDADFPRLEEGGEDNNTEDGDDDDDDYDDDGEEDGEQGYVYGHQEL